MSRIPSALRVLHLLVLALVFGGAACRDDDRPRYVGENPDLSEADASPIAGTVQGSFDALCPDGARLVPVGESGGVRVNIHCGYRHS